MHARLVTAILGMVASSELIGLAGLAIGMRRRGRTFIELGLGQPDSPSNYAIGLLIAAAYVIATWVTVPAVSNWAFRVSWLKALALLAAAIAGVFEEVVFRGWLMNLLQRRGLSPVLQVVISGLSFGIVHAVWGIGHPTVVNLVEPVIWTTALGLALAALYLRSGRSLGPVIVAHFVVDALIEPGLLISAL
jgi:membrane protease YdiL (CAAX protease family)